MILAILAVIGAPIALVLILRWVRRSQARYWGWDEDQ